MTVARSILTISLFLLIAHVVVSANMTRNIEIPFSNFGRGNVHSVFRVIIQSLVANTGMSLKLNSQKFLPKSFQYITHE